MKIRNIRIQNVRGISDYTITEEIYKNKPHILVAQNGFGKTSVATAFKFAAEQTMLKFKSDEDRYLHSPSNKAVLSLDYKRQDTWTTLNATEAAHSNTIRKEFDLIVISDLSEIAASSQNFGKFQTKAKGKQIIPPIDLGPAIKKPHNPYSLQAAKKEWGACSRHLKNLNHSLFTRDPLKERCEEICEPISQLKKKRAWARFDTIREKIKDFSGNEADRESSIEGSIAELIQADASFASALKLLKETVDLESFDAYLTLWQLVFTAHSQESELKHYLEWLRYDAFKSGVKEGAGKLCKAWKQPSVKESNKRLLIHLPEPKHISNGQRDVLSLYALFQKAKYCLKKQRAILIIDEVFDYLDDANLTVAQYYVTQLIQEYKNAGKELYPIILTHLNPAFFKNYAFSNQKVIYLAPATAQASVEAMRKLIAARSDTNVCDTLKDKISKYLVHYHDQEIDFSVELQSINGSRASWGKPGKFNEFLQEEFEKYAEGSDNDPLAICAITRRSIEKQAYDQIANSPESTQFFEEHGTTPKLDWARQRGAKIPEFHYLLRIVFDDGLHWDQRKSLTPIIAKLANPVVRGLVIKAVSP